MSDTPTRPPNILLITTDQQRWDTLGCYGNSVIQTPYIDALAAGGVRFERAYVQSPVCVSSRASILTGRYPHTHGCRWNFFNLSKDEVTFAHALQKAGYRTLLSGKLHQFQGAQAHGFDRHISAESKFNPFPDDYLAFLKQNGVKGRPNLFFQNPRAYADVYGAYTSQVPEELHIDTFVGKRAVGMLREHGRTHPDAPFLLWASFCSPHLPMDPPPPYDSMYLAGELPSPVIDTPGQWALKPPEHTEFARQWNEKWHMDLSQLSGEALRKVIAFYYGTLSLVDKNIGKIITTLKHMDLYDNTIIIFSSDHGEMLGDHGLLHKGFILYEPVTRVPLIMHFPARWPKGVTTKHIAQSIDILPTMLAAAGVDIPDGVQGRDLASAWSDGADADSDAVAVTEAWYAKALVCGQWKLVHYHGKDYGELYNLAADPHEVNNLYADPGYRRQRLELTLRLLDWSLSAEDARTNMPPAFERKAVDQFQFFTG